MEIAVWQAMAAMIKQVYLHAPLCAPSMGSAEVFGHEKLTNASIILRYFQWFNSLIVLVTKTNIINSLVACDATLHQIIV